MVVTVVSLSRLFLIGLRALASGSTASSSRALVNWLCLLLRCGKRGSVLRSGSSAMRRNGRVSTVISAVAVLRHTFTSSLVSLMMMLKSLASSGSLVSVDSCPGSVQNLELGVYLTGSRFICHLALGVRLTGSARDGAESGDPV